MSVPQTAADRIYQTMREMITTGELAPGARLVQRDLAERFGTSRMPVLEAIRRLERDGIVVSHPKWGAQVRTWSLEDVEATYLVREAIEAVTCRLFAERASAADRAVLTELGRRYDSFALAGDRKGCCTADIELHLHIVRCSRSPSIYRLVENSCVITTTIEQTSWAQESTTGPLRSVGVHDDLIAALLGNDPEKAALAGAEHVRVGFQKLRSRIAARMKEAQP